MTEIEFVDDPDIEGVGTNDVAIRKGQTYATAIYDLKDHHLIALLEGREADNLKEWLEKHKKINLVTRDRASAYATAISAVLPDCVQVADRFHLLQNLLEHMKDIFKEEMPSQIYVKDGTVLEQEPVKIQQEKQPDTAYLDTLHYDNEPPQNPEGSELALGSIFLQISNIGIRQKTEKKQQMILEIQDYWNGLEKKKIFG